tara:strand:- start:78 stop:335 length:258 start_codon:yes stop_codon:yes gene_type:complete
MIPIRGVQDMVVYRATVNRGDEVVAVFHDHDLTRANNAARSVVLSGDAVTITTVIEAVDGLWEDGSDENLVMRYRIATPSDIGYD